MKISPLNEVPDLSQRAYNAIKEAILTLQIQPGEILSTIRLAKQLNISRTPVREALLRLERDGLVVVMPQKGAVVTGITVEDVREIYELRIILKSYAVKKAATTLTDEELAYLETVMQKADDAFTRGERKLASNIARELHDVLINKVNNRRLTVFLEELDSSYERIRHFSILIPDRLERSFEQHKAILAALRVRNPSQAEHAIEDHLISVREEILSSIDSWANILDTASKLNTSQEDQIETDAK